VEDDISRYEYLINHGGLGEEDQEDLVKRINGLRRHISELQTEFKEDLARSLIDVVSDATSMYVMSYSEAVYTVDEWLLSDQPEISLPWLEVFDED